MEEILINRPTPESAEHQALVALADKLDRLQQIKNQGKGDPILLKLIRLLRARDSQGAKIFCVNECDKFNSYRNDGLPLIIEKLYGGTGSPWSSIEKKLRPSKTQ